MKSIGLHVRFSVVVGVFVASRYFRASELLPGTYRVEVHLAGFQNWVERSIQIDANQLRSAYPKTANRRTGQASSAASPCLSRVWCAMWTSEENYSYNSDYMLWFPV